MALTDFSASPCAFSEAPAESIFSIYGRVTEGRESLNITNAVALTRIACHGPPVGTFEAKSLAEEALQDYHIQVWSTILHTHVVQRSNFKSHEEGSK